VFLSEMDVVGPDVVIFIMLVARAPRLVGWLVEGGNGLRRHLFVYFKFYLQLQ